MKKHLGFSLIELMITVAIVGILTAIALPSYKSYLRKGARAEAQSHMMDIAQREGQFLLDNRAYASTVAALNMTTPANVASKYTLTITAPATTPPSFTITATPTGDQVNEACGTLTLNNTGDKTASGSGSCW